MLLLSIIQKSAFIFFEWNTFPFNSFPDVGWSAFDSLLLAKQPPRSILFMKSNVTFYKQKHPGICGYPGAEISIHSSKMYSSYAGIIQIRFSGSRLLHLISAGRFTSSPFNCMYRILHIISNVNHATINYRIP